MTSRISHTTIDARDAYAQSVWWGRVPGMSEDPEDPNEPGHEECTIFSPDGRTRVLFLVVPEAKTELKNRIHFDLRPTDGARDAEVERLLGLGATVVADRRVRRIRLVHPRRPGGQRVLRPARRLRDQQPVRAPE